MCIVSPTVLKNIPSNPMKDQKSKVSIAYGGIQPLARPLHGRTHFARDGNSIRKNNTHTPPAKEMDFLLF
jgi:hypothetical protein